jgi:hypothetical protein
MKAYNKYMDKISVSNTLHEKIMSRTEARPKRWPIMIKRYTAAFACLALVLLGVFTIPKLTQHNVAPTPGNNQPALEPGTITPVPDSSSKYTLYFNEADSQSTAKTDIAIRGHFWQELTDEELKAIFPRLTETHAVTATANFQSDESRASLFNIDAQAVSSAGLRHISNSPLVKFYSTMGLMLKQKPQMSSDTACTAGYFEQNRTQRT